MRAFISHSGPDDRYVAEFVQLVRSLGFDEVFNDSHTIEPDEKFWERIERGIHECDAFVVILSQASVKSYWVDKEVQFARSEGKRVIPIRIDDCTLPTSFDGRDVIELKHAGKGQRLSPPRFIHHAAEHFLGREPQLALLDEAWTNGTNVLSIIAWGGVGKTALITEWVQTRFIEKNWKTDDGQPALDAYFDWTFYDQGTRSLADGTEARTGSVGDFFEQAIVFFGDPDPNLPGKGRRLADLIRQQRSLIILDGLEPLQQPPGHPQAGRLLDPDLRDLLAALAQSNPGLCLITSRQALTDLHALRRTVHTEHELEDLPVAIAIQLLRQLQIKGTDQELADASEKFGCHALSLTLLGRYLFDAHGGDIRRIDHIRDLQRADTLTREDRHRTAWRILETYESWLATAQADGNPKTLAVLRLTGLFDRTATADCLAALRAAPIISGLTDSICGMADDEWNILLKRLERAHLIKLRESPYLKSQSSEQSWAIDAHPLIREYFTKQLKQTQLEEFKAAHLRLFEFLISVPSRRTELSANEIQPLYQAIVHGCHIDDPESVLWEVYYERIQNRNAYHATNVLGLIGSDLSALSQFFKKPWSEIDSRLSRAASQFVFRQAAHVLRAAGRYEDAASSAEQALALASGTSDIQGSNCIAAGQVSALKLILGKINYAIETGERAVDLATDCRHSERKVSSLCALANAWFQQGDSSKAKLYFANAERIKQSYLPVLGGQQGYMFNQLFLTLPERIAWKLVMPYSDGSPSVEVPADAIDSCKLVEMRVRQSWESEEEPVPLVSKGLCEFTRRKVALLIRILQGAKSPRPTTELSHANWHSSVVGSLRSAGHQQFVIDALLGAALVAHITNEGKAAQADLDEAQFLAERGPMPLYLADVHLHRARLFGRMNASERKQKFPDIDPKADLAEARRLIEKHGYWRRKEELKDAEAAAIHW